MKLDRRLILNFDWTLFILVLIISGIGLLNIYSAGFSLTDSRLTPLYIRQIQWILIGIAGMAVAFLVDYRFFSRHAYLIYGISVLLLLVVLTAGYATRGSQRWIAVGGFTFQPSEMVKLTIILALAKYFDRSQIGRNYRLRELLIPFLIILIPFLLIIRQPDLGTGLIIIILFFSIVFFVGLDWRSFLLAAAGGLTLTPIGWHLLKDYQKERIITFFSPDRDPLGSGYHIIQSMIAVGSGGFFGKGFLKGSQTQLKFLPEQQTDFVFSVF
ncbi:MAG: FtsW/RodA/SpoVE family cell cycle protein, partial [Proteobacteria bacterium]|nr:FtsW/RodA/SpoVE family cell cycle protein [Pseudomonadota bacterium]